MPAFTPDIESIRLLFLLIQLLDLSRDVERNKRITTGKGAALLKHICP
jgi:hypothetical protein